MIVYKRRLREELERALNSFPVVGLIGSRQVGKTTLAREIAAKQNSVFLDLERPSDLAKLDEPELYLQEQTNKLVVLDEIQRKPELFPLLRSLIDEDRRTGRFLILGSASPKLLRQGSETLAGRIKFLELSPFDITEIISQKGSKQNNINYNTKINSFKSGADDLNELWLHGGYPASFLADNHQASFEWREAFVATFLERDLPQLGFRVNATQARRFWSMLAHVHGQLWNAATLSRSLGVSTPTVRHHLDLLTDMLIVRQLNPLHANVRKRLVKSPKVYIRDSGLLHVLLGIQEYESLWGHPVRGASFEGFVLEQILARIPAHIQPSFFRSHSGDELDLVLRFPNSLVAVEIKHTASPKLSAGFHRARKDLGIQKSYVIYPGTETYIMSEGVQAIPLISFLNLLNSPNI